MPSITRNIVETFQAKEVLKANPQVVKVVAPPPPKPEAAETSSSLLVAKLKQSTAPLSSRVAPSRQKRPPLGFSKQIGFLLITFFTVMRGYFMEGLHLLLGISVLVALQERVPEHNVHPRLGYLSRWDHAWSGGGLAVQYGLTWSTLTVAMASSSMSTSSVFMDGSAFSTPSSAAVGPRGSRAGFGE